MRPLLLPSLRRLWRDSTTLQLGVDPARAVVLTDVDAATSTLLTLLDGRRPLDEVVSRAAAEGVLPDTARELVEGLVACGAVVDAGRRRGSSPAVAAVEDGGRLVPDVAALWLVAGAAAPATLARRRRRCVLIRARGRIGPVVGALLAASGVGRVAVAGSGTVAAADAAVGGLLPRDVGAPYLVAAAAAVRRAAAGHVDTRPPGPRGRPDVVVLAAGPVVPPADRVRWTERGVPHLPVLLRDGTAVVGPMVLPGRTACLHCVELHRRDRDPVWPALAAQLATAPDTEASQVVVAAGAAALTALQVICHLDGRVPEVAGVSLEIAAPGERPRYRRWSAHPECGCRSSPVGRPP